VVAPRIYADFNKLDGPNRLILTCLGTHADLARYGLQLREGMPLTFYMDDADDQGRPDEIVVEGVVHYNAEEKYWVAEVNWDTLHNASDEAVSAGRSHPQPPLDQ